MLSLFLYCCLFVCVVFFFFKQKTAYEMRISDWSSDVCSSDLARSGESELGCLISSSHLTKIGACNDRSLPRICGTCRNRQFWWGLEGPAPRRTRRACRQGGDCACRYRAGCRELGRAHV